jgi:hypothetical protein
MGGLLGTNCAMDGVLALSGSSRNKLRALALGARARPRSRARSEQKKRTPTMSRAVASQSQLTVDIVFGSYSGPKATRIRRSIPSTKGLLTCRVLTELICVLIVRPQSRLNKDLRALLRAPLLALLRSSASTTGLHASSMTRPRSQRAFVRNTKTKTTHRHMRTCVRACMQGRMCACVCVCVCVCLFM